MTSSFSAVVFEDAERAKLLAPKLKHVTVYSNETVWDSKFNLHCEETGKILTQVNTGASIDWSELLDLRKHR